MKKVTDKANWKDLDKKDDNLVELPGGVPRLTLTAFAYQKLCYWEAMSKKEEMSCFGISTRKENLMRVSELYMPAQEVTANSTDPTAEGIADMFDTLLGVGLEPCQFARIWIHTHPFKSEPSATDYTTCREVFGECDWFIMLVKGNDGFTCYMYSMTGIPVRNKLAVGIDYCNPGLPAKIVQGWTDTFKNNIVEKKGKEDKDAVRTVDFCGYLGASYTPTLKNVASEPDGNKLSIHQRAKGAGLGAGTGNIIHTPTHQPRNPSIPPTP